MSRSRVVFHFTAALVVFLTGCTSGEKVVKKEEHYSNGQIKSRVEYHIKNGEEVLWGEATYYYPGGGVETHCEHANGKKHGVFESFFESGSPQSSGHFAFGRRDGEWTEWDEQGKETKSTYKNGELVKDAAGKS